MQIFSSYSLICTLLENIPALARDVKALSHRDRLKSPPRFQLGSAALKVASICFHNNAPSLPTSFMRTPGAV